MTDSDVIRRGIALRSCFSPGKPITRSTLFGGRAAQVSRGIEVVFEAGTHGIIFGERGVGKTSLANCLADFIPGDSEPELIRYSTPRVNCTSVSDYSIVWRDIFQKIDVATFSQTPGFTSASTQTIRLSEELENDTVSPSDVLRLLDIAASQRDLIIVLDEFDAVPDNNTRNLMAHTIKALSDHTTGVTLFIVGVADTVGELIEEHESISRCLIQILMPRMDLDEVVSIVNLAVGRFNEQQEDGFHLTVHEKALYAIGGVSRGMPFYAHLLGREAGVVAIEDESSVVTDLHVRRGMIKALGDVQQQHLSAYQKATQAPTKTFTVKC